MAEQIEVGGPVQKFYLHIRWNSMWLCFSVSEYSLWALEFLVNFKPSEVVY